MTDLAAELSGRIKAVVASSQDGVLDGLTGKYVKRDGVTFLVVKVDRKGGRVTVSDVKTPVKQTTVFSIQSFLGKAIEPVEM